jgi:hypothetical protein
MSQLCYDFYLNFIDGEIEDQKDQTIRLRQLHKLNGRLRPGIYLPTVPLLPKQALSREIKRTGSTECTYVSKTINLYHNMIFVGSAK